MRLPGLVYDLYERRLAASLDHDRIPRHVGVIFDGNRRWAKLSGAPTSDGHRAGANKIHEFLFWCVETGVEVVTLYLLSTDNLNRSAEELEALIGIIGDLIDQIGQSEKFRIHPVGAMELLPDGLSDRIERLAEQTAHRQGLHVNVAVGYGGRREIVDAVRALMRDESAQGKTLEELARTLSADDISSHLYTSGQPDPDLVIRTSGEQRLSGFLLWQSAYSEFYFCEALWPDFRRIDFLRAMRDYASRQRRFGS